MTRKYIGVIVFPDSISSIAVYNATILILVGYTYTMKWKLT